MCSVRAKAINYDIKPLFVKYKGTKIGAKIEEALAKRDLFTHRAFRPMKSEWF